MKLFVWEKVLCDYSCGIVVIYAKSEEQAWRMLKDYDDYAFRQLAGIDLYLDESEQIDDPARLAKGESPKAMRPKLITKEKVFVVNGGS